MAVCNFVCKIRIFVELLSNLVIGIKYNYTVTDIHENRRKPWCFIVVTHCLFVHIRVHYIVHSKKKRIKMQHGQLRSILNSGSLHKILEFPSVYFLNKFRI